MKKRSYCVRRWSAVAALSVAIGMLVGCKAQAPLVPPVSINPEEPCSVEIPKEGLALVVHKAARKLAVVNDGVPIYEFPVVMGPATRGPKRFEGDMRTPEGMYHVIGKHPHARWRYFIALDYPNDEDVAAYSKAIAAGEVELVNGEFPGLGGAIGIHGSDHLEDQADGTNWTRGCVAMRSADVEKIYPMVGRGTPVLILP
jgi:murein L,D-transpeptidase YafK